MEEFGRLNFCLHLLQMLLILVKSNLFRCVVEGGRHHLGKQFDVEGQQKLHEGHNDEHGEGDEAEYVGQSANQLNNFKFIIVWFKKQNLELFFKNFNKS